MKQLKFRWPQPVQWALIRECIRQHTLPEQGNINLSIYNQAWFTFKAIISLILLKRIKLQTNKYHYYEDEPISICMFNQQPGFNGEWDYLEWKELVVSSQGLELGIEIMDTQNM